MNYSDQSGPEIPGFESKHHQPTTGTDFKTLGITAACVAAGVILFCQFTGTNFLPAIPSAPRAKTEGEADAKRYSWAELQNSIKQSNDERQAAFDQQKEMIESIQESNESHWQNLDIFGEAD